MKYTVEQKISLSTFPYVNVDSKMIREKDDSKQQLSLRYPVPWKAFREESPKRLAAYTTGYFEILSKGFFKSDKENNKSLFGVIYKKKKGDEVFYITEFILADTLGEANAIASDMESTNKDLKEDVGSNVIAYGSNISEIAEDAVNAKIKLATKIIDGKDIYATMDKLPEYDHKYFCFVEMFKEGDNNVKNT